MAADEIEELDLTMLDPRLGLSRPPSTERVTGGRRSETREAWLAVKWLLRVIKWSCSHDHHADFERRLLFACGDERQVAFGRVIFIAEAKWLRDLLRDVLAGR